MSDMIEARLLAGPFDGDEGRLKDPEPDRVWVYSCGNPPRECPFRGIHWVRSAAGAPSRAVIYERGPVVEGVQLYVYRDLGLQSQDKHRLETPAELAPR